MKGQHAEKVYRASAAQLRAMALRTIQAPEKPELCVCGRPRVVPEHAYVPLRAFHAFRKPEPAG